MAKRINLSGPEGNAYCLMGLVRSVASKTGLSTEERDRITSDMRSGDYAHLLDVMEREFPGLFQFINDPRINA